MRKDITLTAEARPARGKNEARRLRASGSTPAVIYGVSDTSVAVAISPKEITRILSSKTGHNTIFNVAVREGENTPVMIVDWQTDPVKDTLLHVDLKRIDLTVRIIVKVPVHTHGEPSGVKLQGGLHEVITREIEVECLPDDIPEEFIVDVSTLALNQAVRASAIPMTGSMRLVSPGDAVISHVVALKAEVAETPADGAVATGSEPEVIKKGKKEEEGAAGDKKAEKKPEAKKK